jgi:hypothetical protein
MFLLGDDKIEDYDKTNFVGSLVQVADNIQLCEGDEELLLFSFSDANLLPAEDSAVYTTDNYRQQCV